MKIKELTYDENQKLNRLLKVFQALTLNCEIVEGSNQFEIISQICYELRPEMLIHCYSYNELIIILKGITNKNSTLTGYEIINGIVNLGVIDTFNIPINDITSKLKKRMKNSFMYFFVCHNEDNSFIITFNPKIKYKDVSDFIISKDLSYACHFVQIGDIELTRSLEICEKTDGGNYQLITYNYES